MVAEVDARRRTPPVPGRIGRFDVLLPIASGGMATVYLARSRGARGFERYVAVKVSHPHLSEATEFASTLLDEANLAARIRHKNVVSVLDVGDDPLGLFMVMEYVEGDTLSGLSSAARKAHVSLPLPVSIRIVLDALAGLHAAHELTDDNGKLLCVVHRDFSPQNILVGIDGVAQLTDFGVAKAIGSGTHTATGMIKGKLGYMAPEHAKGHPLDRRADVWSAGVVLWEVIAGRRLYPGGDGVATLLKIVSEAPPLLSTILPDVAPELEAVVAKALTPELDRRCPTAAALAHGLSQALKSAGCVIAEHDEVARYLKELVGSKLTDRRARIEEAISLRANLDELASASISDSVGSSSSLPALAGASSSRSLPVLPALEALAITDAATVMNRRSPAWLVAALAGMAFLLLTGIGLIFAAWPKGGHVASESAASSASVRLMSSPVVAATPSASAASSPPSASALALGTPAKGAREASEVHVVADAPITSLRVENRSITLPSATSQLTFSRTAAEEGQALRLQIVAVDGRRVVWSLPADGTSLRVVFPTARTSPVQSATSPKPSCDPPYTLVDGVRVPKRQCF